MFKTILAAAVMAGGFAFGSAASAATVTFAAGSFVDQGGATRSIFDVVITDISGGVNVAVTQHSSSADGDVLLLGLEGPNLAGATFTMHPDPQTGDQITAICTSGTVTGCGGSQGGDFTGGAFDAPNNGQPGGAFYQAYGFFDTILRIGRQGVVGGNFNNGFDIDITGILGLMATDFTVVGIRAQETSGVGTNSLKIYNDDPNMPPIPLPAGGLLLLTALAGAGLVGRRRKTA